MKNYLRVIATPLLAAFLFLSMAPAQAAMVSSNDIVKEQMAAYDKQQLLAMLDRDQAQKQLLALGVDAKDVKDRVANMTSEEVAQLNTQLNEMQAGGDVLTVILVVFLVFVITDVIGATDIFPFIHPVD